MQAAGNPHNGGSAVGLALVAARFVLGGVPSGGDLYALGIQGNTFVITFGRSDHSKAPIFRDQSDPVSGKILRRGGVRCARSAGPRILFPSPPRRPPAHSYSGNLPDRPSEH